MGLLEEAALAYRDSERLAARKTRLEGYKLEVIQAARDGRTSRAFSVSPITSGCVFDPDYVSPEELEEAALYFEEEMFEVRREVGRDNHLRLIEVSGWVTEVP